MNRNTFRSSIFITAMLAASAAFAGADIVKCVDQDGRVTLTDSQCGTGVQTLVVAGSADTPATDAESLDSAALPAAPVARRTIRRVVLAPAQMRHDNWSSQRPSGKMFARDIETLKAARLSMQVLDEASATLRHQRLAGLN